MGKPLPFAQGYYVSESLPISAQECINLYPNTPQTGTVTKQALFSTPGLKQIATADNDQPNRGMHLFNQIPYAVNGDTLYRIDRTFNSANDEVYSAISVGVGLGGSSRVVMADNGPVNSGGGAGQLCIVLPDLDDQFNAYIYTISGGLVQISDSDFDGPVSSVVYVDGFFLFTKKDGKSFFISNINDGFNYTATDFLAANVDPDPIRTSFVLRNEVYIFGSQTLEPFQKITVTGTQIPFARIPGSVQDKGINAPLTLIEVDGNMAWVGSAINEQPSIWVSNGGKPQKISTRAIDNQIRQYSDEVIGAAYALTYSESGSLFAAFVFPDEEVFVYDFTESLWHTRQSRVRQAPFVWRVSAIKEAYGKLLVGDIYNNNFGLLDKEIYTEYGNDINRRFVLPPLDNGGDPFFMDSIELVGETGLGELQGEFDDPHVLLSWSDDGGRVFGDSLATSFGKQGDYNARCIWDQLGRIARSRMIRFDMSGPFKWAFYKVEANFE